MTKISQLSSIGDSLAVNDQFLIRDVDDTTTPNKSVTVSGITRALDVGSATAPAIAFATDKNTGIYSPGADQVAISTNGSGRLFVDVSGNVGLGISPTNRLHVYASGVSTPALIESTSTVARIAFKDSGTTDSNTVRLGSAGNDLSALAGGSERLRITSAGLVGIGTTSPSNTLHVAGIARIANSAGGELILEDSDQADGDRPFQRIVSDGGSLVFLNANRSGTGITSSTERLRITSTGQVRLAGAGITFNGDTATANELDDYEEGTWTVELYDASSAGNISATTATGYYTKIGRLVSIFFKISNIDTTGMTGANVLFHTLPFAAGSNASTAKGTAVLDTVTFPAGRTYPVAYVNSSAARGFIATQGTGVTSSSLTVSALTSGASDIEVSLTYFT